MKNAYVIEDRGDVTIIATDDDGDGIYSDVHAVHVINRNNDYATIATGNDFSNVQNVHLMSSQEVQYGSQPSVRQVAQRRVLPSATSKDYKRAAKIAIAFLVIAIIAFIAHAIKFFLF